MFVPPGILMVLYLTTGIPNLVAFPTAILQSQQNDDVADSKNNNAQTREEGDEEGYESTSGPFSQENLQAMGQQAGEQMFQEIKTTTKEEAVHALHKVEDKMVPVPPNQQPTFSNNDQALREFENILALNGKRFMSDVVRSFLSPEEIKSAMGVEQATISSLHSTNEEGTLEPSNLPASVVTPHSRPSRNIQQDELSKASDEAKASSPSSNSFPYIPGYTSNGSSFSSNSNPMYGGYAPGGLSTPGHSDATLIVGGFNILLVPMPGVSASNMGNALQNSQQLSQLAPGNPFAANKAAV